MEIAELRVSGSCAIPRIGFQVVVCQVRLEHGAAALCRNRQLTVFLATVDWFQPGFVLMENVQASRARIDPGFEQQISLHVPQV